MVLEPTAVGNLVQLIAGAFNARAADEGRSFFSKPGGGNKIGMKVVDERVTIISPIRMDPDAPRRSVRAATACRSAKRVWIENGVVKNALLRPLLGAEAGRDSRTRAVAAGGGSAAALAA